MHDRLSTVDPLEATKIHPHNKVRVLRALELFYLTGKCKSELVATGAYRKPRYQYTYYCLQPPRGLLYNRIDRRVEEMLAAGWAAELKTLVERGLTENIRKARVIGYSELLTYLECGESDLNACTALIKQSTRRYAKRQMTWFRQQVRCRVFEEAERLVEVVSSELSVTLKS
jgi:tRNA dimethylallyltransferase